MVAAGRQQEPDIRHREGEKRRLRHREGQRRIGGKVPVETLGETRAHWDPRGTKGLPLLPLPPLPLPLRLAS